MPQVVLLVMDSVGVGHAPDAAEYGDVGANTLGHLLEGRESLALPNLESLGLRAALAMAAGFPVAQFPAHSAVGVMREVSAGKDTTTGHWEMAGVLLPEPFATFTAFPDALVAAVEAEAGVRFVGNRPASGTVIIDQLGEQSVLEGRPILYTSADSVFQVAAHEEHFGLERLQNLCRIARRHADAWRIGRVIARPFDGADGAFRRTGNRHDYAMTPPETVLNRLQAAGIPVRAVGKIADIFAGSGISESWPTHSNAEGMERTEALMRATGEGLIFVNLVDFDMLFGHRRDAVGYFQALEEFDQWLGHLLGWMAGEPNRERRLIITADHGNDPTWRGTDHTREQVPVFVVGGGCRGGLGQRDSFADVAATVARWFGLPTEPHGNPFL